MQITHSKDGVEIPEEGLPFEFTIPERDGEPEHIERIVLHDVLAGLNVKVNEGKRQSQATSFASFALQMGFKNEQEILEKHQKARPFMKNGEVECYSWGLISDWEGQVTAERQRKARETMRANGTEISPRQMDYAFSLVDSLRKANFDKAADTLWDLIQVNEEIEGPKGAEMQAAISKATRLLEMAQPRQSQGSQSRPQTTHVSDTPVPATEQEQSTEEPF